MINIQKHIISEAFEQLSKSEKLNESSLFDEKDILHKIDQFQSSITIDKQYQSQMRNILDKKNINYQIDDRKPGKLRFKLYYPKSNVKFDESKLTEKLDKKEIDLKLLNKDPAIFVSPEDAFELSQYLDSKNILYDTRNVSGINLDNYKKESKRAFDIDYSAPRSIATPNEMVTLPRSECTALGTISAYTHAFDFPYRIPLNGKLPRISRSDLYKLKSLLNDLREIFKDPEYQDKQDELVDKISNIVSEIRGINESLITEANFMESTTQFDIRAVLNANGDYEDLTKVVKDPSKIIVYDTWNQMLKDRDNRHTYYIRQNGDKEYEVMKYSKWSGDQYVGYIGPRGYSSLEELYARNPGKYDTDDVCLVKEFHIEEKLLEEQKPLRKMDINELRDTAVSLGADRKKLYGTSKQTLMLIIDQLKKKNKDNSKKDILMNKMAEDYNEVNECKLGTNEYEANPKRKQHIEMYRKFANLNESEEITEDNINDWALQKTATYCNRHPDRIKAEILGKRYSEYERD